jgi:hypothetical protein
VYIQFPYRTYVPETGARFKVGIRYVPRIPVEGMAGRTHSGVLFSFEYSSIMPRIPIGLETPKIYIYCIASKVLNSYCHVKNEVKYHMQIGSGDISIFSIWYLRNILLKRHCLSLAHRAPAPVSALASTSVCINESSAQLISPRYPLIGTCVQKTLGTNYFPVNKYVTVLLLLALRTPRLRDIYLLGDGHRSGFGIKVVYVVVIAANIKRISSM